MNGRQRIIRTFNRQETDRCPFWKGNPSPIESSKIAKYFMTSTDPISLAKALNDDMIFMPGEEYCWNQGDGRPFLDVYAGKDDQTLGGPGFFDGIKDLKELDSFPWPDLDLLDWNRYRSALKEAQDAGYATAGGFWSPFFHNISDLLGMENYFMMMYTDPEIVQALTKRVVELYLEANRRCFEELGDLIDIFFFGNDFGTQRDLLISPTSFETFVLPYFQQLVNLGKEYGKFVLLHSCGSIYRVIPQLIDAGIDGLHPLQALAINMDAETLKQYKKQLIFVGGIDTQELLPNGSTDEVQKKVKELIEVLGPGYIVSPSHEALMEDVPVENIVAMSEAVRTPIKYHSV